MTRGPARSFPERDAEITRLVAEGWLSLEEIGQRFGITRERVRQIAKRNGQSRNHVYVPARPRFGRLVVCSHCGALVPMGTLRRHNEEKDHKTFPRQKLRPSDLRLIREAYLRGLGYKTLGALFGVHQENIKQHVVRMGIPRRGAGKYDRNRAARLRLIADVRAARSVA